MTTREELMTLVAEWERGETDKIAAAIVDSFGARCRADEDMLKALLRERDEARKIAESYRDDWIRCVSDRGIESVRLPWEPVPL